jgi:hypothetical protein
VVCFPRFPLKHPVHASPLTQPRYMPCLPHSRFYHLYNNWVRSTDREPLIPLSQGSSTFQIVRATLTISIMPAGHKAIHDVHVHIIGKSGRSVNLTTNRYIMCRQRAGLWFVVIFSKRPADHGKGLRGPCGPRATRWRPLP